MLLESHDTIEFLVTLLLFKNKFSVTLLIWNVEMFIA